MPSVSGKRDPLYARPPITEAIIALHFKTPLEPKAIERFVAKRKSQFPRNEQLVQHSVRMGGGQKPLTTSNPAGAKLTSADQSRIIRIGEQQFGVIHLAPYRQWETLLDDARDQWAVMRKIVPGKQIDKVSTRFINRLDIPTKGEKSVSLKDYCRTGVSVPPEMASGSMEQFAMQCQILDEGKEFLQILQLALQTPPPVIDHVSVILDIDVATATPVPSNDEDLWSVLDKLRGIKNRIFEACITDKARELFR